MIDLRLARSAKVEVRADEAGVACANDRWSQARVALHLMLLDAEVVNEEVDRRFVIRTLKVLLDQA